MPTTIIPYVPRTITVHLGPPNSNAQNVTVPFVDYIKNVASSEIYPTWDEDALFANILAQISFALNRVYTEFYRAQGKNFDITSSTAIDQKFINGRNIFESIERIVDNIFNDYIRRIGFVEPLAAKFCNGTTVTCDGLSQWGSENLAQQGLSYLDILYRYYGYDIELVIDAPIQNIRNSYPGYAFSRGDTGRLVQVIQTELNRISINYPAINKIYPVDGIFGENTENAVRQFQRIFSLTPDGIVGKATWYKLVSLYTGILQLSELSSEGQRLFGFDLQYPDAIELGDRGEKVTILQYFLNFIAEFDPTIPAVAIDGIFGKETQNAVIAYQRNNNLPPTGVADEVTWNGIYDQFVGIVRTEYLNGDRLMIRSVPFSGTTLIPGATGGEVTFLQQMLNYIAITFRNIPAPPVTGVYDAATEQAVRAYQVQYGLPVTGTVDRAAWNAISNTYQDAVSVTLTRPTQFPGRTLRRGDSDPVAGVTRVEAGEFYG